jgi:hypothetical protein
MQRTIFCVLSGSLLIVTLSCATTRPKDRVGPVAAASAGPASALFLTNTPAAVHLDWHPDEAPLMYPRINGVEVGPVVLDTGTTGMLITDELVKQANLKPVGTTRLQDGARSTVYRSESFQLGPLILSGTTYASADFPFELFSSNQLVRGICGYPIFAAAVVELDLAGATMRIHDPATYVLPTGQWQRLYVESDLPHVWCRFEGDHAGLFLLDVGFGASVWFFDHAVERFDLLEERETVQRRILNFGASTTVQHGALQWLQIGQTRIDSTMADFSTSKMRVYPGPPEVLGIIGTELLSKYRIVFDYPHERIAFLDGK